MSSNSDPNFNSAAFSIDAAADDDDGFELPLPTLPPVPLLWWSVLLLPSPGLEEDALGADVPLLMFAFVFMDEELIVVDEPLIEEDRFI